MTGCNLIVKETTETVTQCNQIKLEEFVNMLYPLQTILILSYSWWMFFKDKTKISAYVWSEPELSSSKSAIETLEECAKSVKDTRTISSMLFCCL